MEAVQPAGEIQRPASPQQLPEEKLENGLLRDDTLKQKDAGSDSSEHDEAW